MRTCEVDGVRVSFAEAGAGGGEPVVLLHCTGGSGAQWRALMERLGGRFRVLAPDRHGCGGTDPWPGRGPLTLADEAGLVAEVAARFAGGPVHLVGHSSGGAVALRLALDRPDLLRSLTLIEPASFHLLREGGAADRALLAEVGAVAEAVFAAAVGGDYHGGLERFVDYWGGPGAWARLPEERRAALARGIGKVALDFSAAMAEPTPLAAYQRVAVPTLVVRGGSSPAPTRRIAGLLAGAIPRARLETVAGVGHMLPLTHPEAVAAAVEPHLGRDARRRDGRRRAA
jgi:pimeloyl-ACP methyl ester carboxylesterase